MYRLELENSTLDPCTPGRRRHDHPCRVCSWTMSKKKENDLRKAALEGDVAALSSLIASGVDIEAPQPKVRVHPTTNTHVFCILARPWSHVPNPLLANALRARGGAIGRSNCPDVRERQRLY